MALYKMADMYFKMNPTLPTLSSQSIPYECSEKEEEILASGNRIFDLTLSAETIEEYNKMRPELTLDECEYLLCGYGFTRYLLEGNGMMLHSSAVVYKDRAYLFTANCGTGKSTHTNLWTKTFDGAYIINDDKPAIRLIDGKFYVYGSPFSGKCDLSRNTRAPLQAVCLLERGENRIEKADDLFALSFIMGQIYRPKEEKNMDKCLSFLDRLITNIPIYRMQCTISEDAARMAYNAMSENKE